MTNAPAIVGPTSSGRPSLRERKKARTKASIQQQAIALFTGKGYDATTIDDICEAAEVGRTTFFRYFSTKEELVTSVELNALIIAAVRAQPPGVSPVRALRRAMAAVFADVSPADMTELRARMELMASVPALRAAFLAEMARITETMEEVLAGRSGRDRGDLAVRAHFGALLGVLMSVFHHQHEIGEAGLPAAIDAALGYFEAGLPLSADGATPVATWEEPVP